MAVIVARTPWTAKVVELLADGEWHPRETVIVEAMKTFPPGRAFRAGERERARLAERDGYQYGPRRHGDDDTSVSTGARRRVMGNVHSLIKAGRLERALVDGVDCLRLARANSRSKAS